MRGPRIIETRRARILRADQTFTEAKLWARLRNRQLNGFKFSRQVPISIYFADFCCREKKLVIEIDGATHSTDAEMRNDRKRSVVIQSEGYEVMRFLNIEVFENIDGVLETILARLEERDYL